MDEPLIIFLKMFEEVSLWLFIASLRGILMWLEWHGQGLLDTGKQEKKAT